MIARELVTVLAAEIGLRRGMDVEVNWLGRIGVWVAMTAIFVALAVDTWVSTALLLVGLAALILATVLYVRSGLGPKPSTLDAEPCPRPPNRGRVGAGLRNG